MSTITRVLALALALSSGAAVAQEGPAQRDASGVQLASYDQLSPSSPSGGVSAFTAADGAGSWSGLSVSAGASYSSGDYGSATNTDIWSVPLGVRLKTGALRLSASVPWMRIRSDGTVFTGIDATPLVVAPGIRSTRRVRSGVGDLTLGASYDLPTLGGSGLDVELSGRVKLPTASDRSQLSTGKTDYSFGGQVSRQFGRLTPFASATYRVFGDVGPWDLRNGMAASAGASYALPGRAIVVASYDYARAASPFVSDSHELFGGVSVPIAHTPLRLTAFGTAGLSRGAAGASGGLSLTASL
jgi:hypothetical protein